MGGGGRDVHSKWGVAYSCIKVVSCECMTSLVRLEKILKITNSGVIDCNFKSVKKFQTYPFELLGQVCTMGKSILNHIDM